MSVGYSLRSSTQIFHSRSVSLRNATTINTEQALITVATSRCIENISIQNYASKARCWHQCQISSSKPPRHVHTYHVPLIRLQHTELQNDDADDDWMINRLKAFKRTEQEVIRSYKYWKLTTLGRQEGCQKDYCSTLGRLLSYQSFNQSIRFYFRQKTSIVNR